MVGKEVNHEKTYPYAGYEVLTYSTYIFILNVHNIHISR